MSQLPANPSPEFMRLNPHLYGNAAPKLAIAQPAQRIRQNEPKIRPWEREWADRLLASGNWSNVKLQSIRVRLAHGAWFKPDVSSVENGCLGDLHCWEIKGGAKMKGVAKGILALKVAAAQYPEIAWHLCWKEHGEWKEQRVLP
jgi:hypothetical protein